jgi:UDP-N-acetylglucosamine 2-epimerase (non-hydrolysing)
MREVLEFYSDSIERSQVLQRLKLEPGGYFLASVHRQENVDSLPRLTEILAGLDGLSLKWNLPVLVSTHPRTKNRLNEQVSTKSNRLIFHEPFGFFDYNKLQKCACCVISDSGSISEESAISGFRAVSFRDSIERPESLDNGSMILAGTGPSGLKRSVEYVLSRNLEHALVPDGYEVRDFSERVTSILFSTVGQHVFWSGLRSNLR